MLYEIKEQFGGNHKLIGVESCMRFKISVGKTRAKSHQSLSASHGEVVRYAYGPTLYDAWVNLKYVMNGDRGSYRERQLDSLGR